MSTSFRALILLAVIFWQSIAMLGPVILAQRAGELAHMAVHVQDANHHHHADHAMHLDDDTGAPQHLHADAGHGISGLLASSAPSMTRISAILALEARPAFWRSPSLEGPLRPPKLKA